MSQRIMASLVEGVVAIFPDHNTRSHSNAEVFARHTAAMFLFHVAPMLQPLILETWVAWEPGYVKTSSEKLETGVAISFLGVATYGSLCWRLRPPEISFALHIYFESFDQFFRIVVVCVRERVCVCVCVCGVKV